MTSLPARPCRISAQALDRIAGDLGDLDAQVLGFLGETRLATGTQLVRRFWITGNGDRDREARNGRRALKRLSDWRVIDPLPGRARGGTRGGSDTLIYSVGAAGSRLLARRGSVRRLGTPGARHIAHTLTITELVLRLHEADAAGTLECLAVQPEPTCWQPFLGAFGARLILKPDLVIRVAAPGSDYEHRWALEIDMATESPSTIRSKALRYLAHYHSGSEQAKHRVYPRVLWVVPNEQRAEQIRQVVRRLPSDAERLFTICRFENAVALLTSEARS
ncbi:MAG TPA: replication-relaxation family protein [Solirubrobacteraceae bacterium]